MSRQLDVDRRTELAYLVAQYFIATGNIRGSLRDIAPEIGTSARMLVHYFGSREVLLGNALEIARGHQIAAAEAVMNSSTDIAKVLDNIWRWYVREDTKRFFILFNDVAALELSDPEHTRHFGGRFGSEWLPMFERLFRSDPRFTRQARPLARLIIATIRGFALDFNSGVAAKDQKPAYFALVEMILKK